MKWQKMGLIFAPDGLKPWARHSALQPTPILLEDENVIRVFAGFRDDGGIGRIGYVDLDPQDPSRVLRESKDPVLDVGDPGCFDENGVVPCAVLRHAGKLYMYYAGYQLGQKVRFYVFSGLAISEDNGRSFRRYSNVPVTDRSDDELFFKVIHSIMFDQGKWRCWYGGGSSFDQGANKTLPRYNVRHLESETLFRFPVSGQVVIDMTGEEHRVGRPYVIKNDGIYYMFYGVGTESVPYKLGYSISKDGISWIRKDSEIGIDFSENGWDSEMMAYPAIVKFKDSIYLFYNGNDYGKFGFGYAVLEKW